MPISFFQFGIIFSNGLLHGKEICLLLISMILFFNRLQVVFVPDYNVSVAEVLIPGSELSQHIRYFDLAHKSGLTPKLSAKS